MKGNLELRPGEQLRHPLHPWNRPHLSLSGGFTRWDGFPSSWAARAFGRVAHHSPPGRSRPRSSADLTDSRTKKSAGMNGSSLVAHFPCAFPRAFLWGSELRAFWLCCYGLNEQVCFYPFFFFFFAIKTKKGAETDWIWKMTSMLPNQRLRDNQNFLFLQSKSVLTIFNFWT